MLDPAKYGLPEGGGISIGSRNAPEHGAIWRKRSKKGQKTAKTAKPTNFGN